MPLIFDQTDFDDMQIAIDAGGRIWYNPVLDRLKRKIKDYYISNDTSQCCYCSRLFKGEFRMVIDIEHVLPQRHFGSERFVVENLNVACKRCNMEIKNDDLTFLENTLVIGDYYNSTHYKIIHPNLDNYSNHLELLTIRKGNSIFNKYIYFGSFKIQIDRYLIMRSRIDFVCDCQ